jgi:UDP-N-acetylglucosamine--N-acetylmuramyl-(pentapeptide) pyrophosphoryl-undecaprenol N-acetylglucosamine transferase
MKKILFACGGTAGHINPALAVAEEILSRRPETEILFAGSPTGMEAELIPNAGYRFVPIEIAGFQRRVSIENLFRNTRALALLAKSRPRATKIIRDFSPDVAVGTGGYVSGPILRRAAQLGIWTVAHEQNAYPGVTTRLLAPDVDRLLLAFEGARRRLKPADEPKIIVTGNPVRREVQDADRVLSRARLGVGQRLCILSFGGSLGAERINEAVAELMKYTGQWGNVHHIHAAGKRNFDDFLVMLRAQGVDLNRPGLDVRQYIDNMPACLAAADLVICRAGAITVSELCCAARASILIPSPNVAENHQYHNAMELVRAEAAHVIREKDLSGEALAQRVQKLIERPEALRQLGENAGILAVCGAAAKIADVIFELADAGCS